MDEYLGFGEELDLGGVLVDLRAHRRGTIGTEILVFVPLGKDQKKPLAHGYCNPALRAVEGGSFKLFKTRFPFPHELIIKERVPIDNEILHLPTDFLKAAGVKIYKWTPMKIITLHLLVIVVGGFHDSASEIRCWTTSR